MGTKVLRLDSSLFGEDGISSRLCDQLVEQLRALHGELHIRRRDLAAAPLPHFGAEVLAALAAPAQERSEAQRTLVELADGLIEELREADIVVIAAPMYNFSVPSTLKTWMDYVARAGVSFRYTEQGPVGLLGVKRVYAVSSRGGLHRDAPSDAVVPLLRSFFGLLGMPVEVIYAEGLSMGDECRDKGLVAAREQIAHVAA